jgi:DNA repair exonuclease SbcCD ATPase subunit
MSADIRELLAEIERLNAHAEKLADGFRVTTAGLLSERDKAVAALDASNAKCLELAERLVVADARVAHLERTFQEQSQAWALPAERAEKRVAELESKGRKDAAVIADFMAGSQSAIDECDRKGALVQTLRAERDAALARIAELQVTAGALTDRVTELEQAAELNHDKRLMIISRAETAEADVARLRGACNFVLHALRYDEEHAHFRSSHSIGGIREAIREALAAQPTESLKLYGAPPVEASRLTGVLRADPREVVSTESPLSSSASVGAGESHRESPSGAADKGEPAFKKVRPECSGCGCGCRGRPKCDCCCACIGELRCDVVCGQCGTGDAP